MIAADIARIETCLPLSRLTGEGCDESSSSQIDKYNVMMKNKVPVPVNFINGFKR